MTEEMPEVNLYRQASESVRRSMSHHPSIVSSSILSAIAGHFGDHHESRRTEGSKLFINPLMSLYWCFRLEAVVQRNLYLDKIRDTNTYGELNLAINRFRATVESREWIDLPM